MKAQLRKIARSAAGLPLLGRLVRICVAVIRLPETRDAHQRFQAEVLQLLVRSSGESTNLTFQNEQLPSLLQTVSDLNQRQFALDHDQINLVKSVPLALRKLTRDLVEVREQVLGVVTRDLVEMREQARGVVPMLEQRLNDMATEIDAKFVAAGANAQASSAEAMRLLHDAVMADVRESGDRTEQQLAAQQGRLDDLFGSMSYLLGRVEFVRREVMFEMRYGATAPDTDKPQLLASTEILDEKKVNDARVTGLRLNLGCGHIPLDGYLNVDRRPLPGVDIVAEVDQLPFQPGELSEICSAHLLEHFPEEQIRREMLPYWISLLKPDGVFRAIVPDGKAMSHAYVTEEYSFDTLRKVTFGGQDYDGDFHFNMFSPASLTALLKEAGMSQVEVVAENRENGGCKEFEIIARR